MPEFLVKFMRLGAFDQGQDQVPLSNVGSQQRHQLFFKTLDLMPAITRFHGLPPSRRHIRFVVSDILEGLYEFHIKTGSPQNDPI